MFNIIAAIQNVYPRPAFAPHTMSDVVSFIFANKDKLVSFEASLYADFEKANYIPASFLWEGKEVTEDDGTLEISGSFFTEDRFMGSVGNKSRWGALRDSDRILFTDVNDLLFWLDSRAIGTLDLIFRINTKEEKRFTIIL